MQNNIAIIYMKIGYDIKMLKRNIYHKYHILVCECLKNGVLIVS